MRAITRCAAAPHRSCTHTSCLKKTLKNCAPLPPRAATGASPSHKHQATPTMGCHRPGPAAPPRPLPLRQFPRPPPPPADRARFEGAPDAPPSSRRALWSRGALCRRSRAEVGRTCAFVSTVGAVEAEHFIHLAGARGDGVARREPLFDQTGCACQVARRACSKRVDCQCAWVKMSGMVVPSAAWWVMVGKNATASPRNLHSRDRGP